MAGNEYVKVPNIPQSNCLYETSNVLSLWVSGRSDSRVMPSPWSTKPCCKAFWEPNWLEVRKAGEKVMDAERFQSSGP